MADHELTEDEAQAAVERQGEDIEERRLADEAEAVTPESIRAQVDAMAPRVLLNGNLNVQHVAIEQTLRARHALPAYVPALDGPGYLPEKWERP